MERKPDAPQRTKYDTPRPRHDRDYNRPQPPRDRDLKEIARPVQNARPNHGGTPGFIGGNRDDRNRRDDWKDGRRDERRDSRDRFYDDHRDSRDRAGSSGTNRDRNRFR